MESKNGGLPFEFTRTLKKKDQRDDGNRKHDEDGVDTAYLAWYDVKIFCFPKDQPTGANRAFTLTVSAEDGTTGSSTPFHVKEEATMDGKQDGLPEIDAKLVHKWWDPDGPASRAPLHEDGGALDVPLINWGGRCNIYKHPRQSEAHQVLRELKEFPSTAEARRAFLKDLTVWQRVGDKCGDSKIAALRGWYFDPGEDRAGFCMKHYKSSLDESLSTRLLMRMRFDYCDQVLQIMIKLQEEFPFLVFPDVKPKNFLCQQHTAGGETIVLTDLDGVRRVGSTISTHTVPYRHPGWTNTAPTTKLFEQYAITVTLLQILLAMQSTVSESGSNRSGKRARMVPTVQHVWHCKQTRSAAGCG